MVAAVDLVLQTRYFHTVSFTGLVKGRSKTKDYEEGVAHVLEAKTRCVSCVRTKLVNALFNFPMASQDAQSPY